MTRPDPVGFLVGLVMAAIGVAFVLEAEGAWTFRVTQLAVVGPLLLILAGVAVLAHAFNRARTHPPGHG